MGRAHAARTRGEQFEGPGPSRVLFGTAIGLDKLHWWRAA